MRILMEVSSYLDDTTPRPEIIQELASTLADAYNEQAADKEAYLSVDALDDTSVIFGTEDPEAIRCAAREWNNQLRTDLRKAIDHYIAALSTSTATQDIKDNLDNSATYTLKKAAMAADNDFYSFAERALYMQKVGNGALYLRTVLEKEDLQRIQASPEDYAIIEIDPK